MSVLHKSKGIILRSVKYGETSLVVTAFTEKFGLQSYLVNGIRKSHTKGSSRAAFFQPAAILDMVVYFNEFKNLQRIKEFQWAHLYQHILSDVHKNAVALFIIELLTKCLRQPEANPDLFYFVEDALIHLDEANSKVTANFPLFFALHLPVFFGFRFSDSYSTSKHYADLQEGRFVETQPSHSWYLQDREAEIVSHVLKIMRPEELEDLMLNQELRRRILQSMETYYSLHLPEFGILRSLPVLRELMN